MSNKLTDIYPQRKRIAHEPKKALAGSSKTGKAGKKQDEELELLKSFDLTLEFGPCMGITRLERWERAEKHGLNPPREVKEIIEKHSNDELFTQCLWNDYKVLK